MNEIKTIEGKLLVLGPCDTSTPKTKTTTSIVWRDKEFYVKCFKDIILGPKVKIVKMVSLKVFESIAHHFVK
ncbi:unnamed protein product, partial [Ilex paraguariensis]